jgi:membrane protein involved in colicin uptake
LPRWIAPHRAPFVRVSHSLLCYRSPLLHSYSQTIEETVGKEMSLYDVEEAAVLELLKSVNAAKRMAKIRLDDYQLTNKTVKRKKKEGEDEDEEAPEPAQQQQQEKPQRQQKQARREDAAGDERPAQKKQKQQQPAAAASSSKPAAAAASKPAGSQKKLKQPRS